MTTQPGADIIPIRATDAGSAVAFDEGRPDSAAYIDTTDTTRRRDIIPEPLRRGQLADTLSAWAGKTCYQAAYHALRLPWHAIWLSWLAHRGAWRLTCRMFSWANWAEGWLLESQAVAAGRAGHHEAMRAHTEGKKTRGARWRIIGVAAFTAAVVLFGLIRYAPAWAGVLLGLAFYPVLVWHGKPSGRPIIKPAILPPAYAEPTPEVVIQALCSIGIDKINAYVKEHGTLEKVIDLHRDGDGWGSEWDLPRGVTAKMIIERRERLASGLRRPLSATWPEAVPHEHEGRLDLWIGRHDMAKVKPPAYPLLRTGTTDIFGHVPFAVTPRRTGVAVPMFQANWLIGSAPGNGKTAAVRVLASAAALDVICDLWTHEFSGKGDLAPFRQVSHRYVSGLDAESIEYGAESARMLRRELERRSAIFKKLPGDAKPDGALTRELAKADRRLRPIVAIFDEVQNLFLDPDWGPDAADDLAYLIRLGRAYGIIVILATQRPDKDALPTKIRGLVTARFCLKVPDQDGNDMILGTGAYKAGFSAVAFRHEIDAGLGWLRGTGDPQAVKTYYLNMRDTGRVCARARAARLAAGVLSGAAIGADDGEDGRSFAADVLSVFAAGEAKLWCETIAARLRDRAAGSYADITPAAVGSQLRAIGVHVKNVREPGSVPNTGCEREAVERAAGMREVAGV